MKGRMRTAFLLLGAICFAAMASGWILYLHLSHYENPANHDATHCPLCQQLLLSKKDFTVNTEPTSIELEPAERIAAIPSATPIQQAGSNLCGPRAPPA